MKIGIIGEGKMGRDIFNHLFQYDNELVWKCRDAKDIEEIKASVVKQLNKMLKRGYMTEGEHKNKLESFVVTADLAALKDCDLIIEAVMEIKELKQEIFESLDAMVKPECILASNTSSIPLNSIFERCKKKDRCLGIHFFFPVKVTRTVEINVTKHTNPIYAEQVRNLLIEFDKRPLDLQEEANMILSNMLLTMITQINLIYEDGYLTIEEIDKVLKEKLVTFGLFEIIDSTGIHIILKTLESFISDRYRKLYAPFEIKANMLIKEGYGGGAGNKGMYDYEREHPIEFKTLGEAELNQYKESIVLQMQSLLLNEIAYLVQNQYVEKLQICEALQEVLGLSENPISMLKNIGIEKIEACLSEMHQRINDDLYKKMDLSILM